MGKYIKKNRYFYFKEVVKYTGFNRLVVASYLHAFKREGVIFSAGGGIYSTVAEEFSCPANSRVAKIRRIIRKEFPLLDFIVWNTACFQGHYHHPQTHNITFVEVEKYAVQPVAERIARSCRFVSIQKNSKVFKANLDITKDPVIIRSLVSRSPKQGHNPCLEKLLVDLFIIKDKYNIMSDVDYWKLWRRMFSLYRINFGKLTDYARRRINLKSLMPQVIAKLKIDRAIFRAKVGLR